MNRVADGRGSGKAGAGPCARMAQQCCSFLPHPFAVFLAIFPIPPKPHGFRTPAPFLLTSGYSLKNGAARGTARRWSDRGLKDSPHHGGTDMLVLSRKI